VTIRYCASAAQQHAAADTQQLRCACCCVRLSVGVGRLIRMPSVSPQTLTYKRRCGLRLPGRNPDDALARCCPATEQQGLRVAC
jgi:hypothetical protein